MTENESPNVRQILSAITDYSNDVTFASESGQRSGSALALLRIAMSATQELHRVWLDQPGIFDDVEECFREAAPLLPFWPVPFNEVTDLKPYRELRIGYDLLGSKAPSKRTGNTVFSYYARLLVGRIEFLRSESNAQRFGKKWKGLAAHTAKKRSLEAMIALSKAVNGKNPLSPWMALHTHQPEWLGEIGAFPDFSKTSAILWRDTAKKLFKEAIPRCEEVLDLATKINDGGATYESQIRSQIIERIGRAVVALAK